MAGAGMMHGVDTNGLAGAVGNNYFEGMQFTTGTNPVTIANFGRWIPKNTTTAQAHTLELVDQTNGSVLGSVSLPAGLAGGANGQFQYAELPSPIALAADHAYYLASQEFTGGDQRYNSGTAMRPSGLIKSIDGGAYYNGTSWTFLPSPGHTFGPVDVLAAADTSQVTYDVYRSSSPSMAGAIQIASNLTTTNFFDASPGAGTHYYTVTASNGSGESTSLGVGCADTGTPLPDGWSDADWNSPPLAGSAWTTDNDADSITVQGGGDGYTKYQWHYAYRQMPAGSSFTAVVELTSLTQYGRPAAGTMAGLMISDGAGGLNHASYVNVVGGGTLQWSGMYGDNEPMPAWLKLVASYNAANHNYTVTGYYLNSQGQWVKPYNSYANPNTISSSGKLYVGVAVCANGDLANSSLGLATATFANFIITDDHSWDFGDAPDPGYPTLTTSNGARHAVGSLYLGLGVSPESDGRPTADALGDDDDGVSFTTALVQGVSNAGVTVIASQAGRLDAWVDFNGNGSWTEAGEQIFANQTLAAGPNSLTFAVPSTAAAGSTFARFRLSTPGGQSPTGAAVDGEVEDYAVQVTAPASKHTLDVDSNRIAGGLTDGLIVLRYLVGFRGSSLVNGLVDASSQRSNPDEIAQYLDACLTDMLDVDGNQRADAFSDGMLLLRYLFDFRGQGLINGVVGTGATRPPGRSSLSSRRAFPLPPPSRPWPIRESWTNRSASSTSPTQCSLGRSCPGTNG
jgi:hypothetical protein